MRSGLLLAAILCSARWMSVVHALFGPRKPNCCLQWSTDRIPSDRIVNYFIQSKGVCPIRAILLRTAQGETVCSSPYHAWVREAIRKVHEERKKKALQEQGQNEDGSTSSTTPAAPTKKLTTEERQKWKETEAEEVQEREEEAEEMCKDSPQSTNTPPPRVLMYCINNKEP